MRSVVIYDIPEDRLRQKVADACLDFGLDRIQYSAFLGELNPTRGAELMARIRRRLGKSPGRVHLFAFCERDERWCRVINTREREEKGSGGE